MAIYHLTIQRFKLFNVESNVTADIQSQVEAASFFWEPQEALVHLTCLNPIENTGLP